MEKLRFNEVEMEYADFRVVERRRLMGKDTGTILSSEIRKSEEGHP
jgi:hypothetical protein